MRHYHIAYILHVVTFCMLSHLDIFLMADRGVALRLRDHFTCEESWEESCEECCEESSEA